MTIAPAASIHFTQLVGIYEYEAELKSFKSEGKVSIPITGLSVAAALMIRAIRIWNILKQLIFIYKFFGQRIISTDDSSKQFFSKQQVQPQKGNQLLRIYLKQQMIGEQIAQKMTQPKQSNSWGQPSLIIEEPKQLWLGSLSDAQNKKWLKKKGIEAVFTVAIGQPVSYHTEPIRHYEYPIEDRPDYNLKKQLPQILKAIKKEAAQTNILVHCACGVSRSPTVVLAYLIQNGMQFKEAFIKVSSKRPEIRPNPGFLELLRQM